MPENYETVLWELPPGSPTHLFYVVTNLTSYKVGHTTRDLAKRMKGDQQFKGTVIVGKIPCGCGLQEFAGRPTCIHEYNWAQTHKRARLPMSEWYRDTDGHRAALRFRFSTDEQAMAIIDQVERNNRRQSA